MKKYILSIVLALLLIPSLTFSQPYGSPFGPVPPDDTAYDAILWDGSYLAPTQNAVRDWIEGAGGGGIGGADTQVQYNDGGAFGGDAGLTYDDVLDALTVVGPIAGATIDTGQGANDLYDMDQNVQTSDKPSFAGITTTADSDFGGYYINQLQNIPDLASRGASYWFDGVNDYVAVGNDDNLSFGDGTTDNPFSIVIVGTPTSSASFKMLSKGDYNSDFEYGFEIRSSHKLALFIADESVANCYIGRAADDALVLDNIATAFAGTYDGTGASSGCILYINGDVVDSSATESNPGSYVAMENLADDLNIGELGGIYGNGQISRTLLFNLALTEAEVKPLSSGAEVPYKYVGASQTAMVNNGELTVNTAGWSANNYTQTRVDSGIDPGASSGGADDWCLKGVATGDSSRRHVFSVTLERGKTYRIKVRYYTPTGDPDIFVTLGELLSTLYSVSGSTNVKDAWSELVIEHTTQYDGATDLQIGNLSAGGAIGDILYVDAVSVTQIGCVLDLNPEGITPTTWVDASGNDLDGIVSGAIMTNAKPSQYVDGNITASGTIHGKIEIIADDNSLSAAQCYGSLNKLNGAETTTLPAAVVGMNVLLYSDDATVKTIDPDGTDHIWLNGVDNGAGNSIDSPAAVGDYLVLVAFSANNWYSIGQSGVWIDTP